MITNNQNDNLQSIKVIHIVKMRVRNKGNFEEKSNVNMTAFVRSNDYKWTKINIANGPNFKVECPHLKSHILHIFAHQILAVSGGFGQFAKWATPDEWL